MNESEHTPGPWYVAENCTGSDWMVCVSGRNERHAGYVATMAKTNDQSEANAHLIAAAPELLEALNALEFLWQREDETSNDAFERIANVFYQETGYLRPGKDCVAYSRQTREIAWLNWIEAKKKAARAAIAKAEGR